MSNQSTQVKYDDSEDVGNVEDVEDVKDVKDVGHLPLLLRPDQRVLLLMLVQPLVICQLQTFKHPNIK